MLRYEDETMIPANIDVIVRIVLRSKIESAREDRASLLGVISTFSAKRSKRNGTIAFRKLVEYAKNIRRRSEHYFNDMFNSLRLKVHGTRNITDFMEEQSMVSMFSE